MTARRPGLPKLQGRAPEQIQTLRGTSSSLRPQFIKKKKNLCRDSFFVRAKKRPRDPGRKIWFGLPNMVWWKVAGSHRKVFVGTFLGAPRGVSGQACTSSPYRGTTGRSFSPEGGGGGDPSRRIICGAGQRPVFSAHWAATPEQSLTSYRQNVFGADLVFAIEALGLLMAKCMDLRGPVGF